MSLPVVAHPRRVVAFVIVIAVVAAGSFVAGMYVRAPQQTALDSASDQLDVTYAVEERVVSAGVTLAARISPGETRPLTPLAGTAAARLIVTQQTLTPGQVIAPGSLLGEVSGRPKISIPVGVPLYRDLVDGSTGTDVSALQSALHEMGLDVSVTGEVGPRTLAAVVELYSRLPSVAASATTISWTDFLPVSAGATVVSSAEVGTVLTDELPLATIAVSPAAITARANVIEADQLVVGQSVEVRSGGTSATSTVLAIGDFTTPDDGSSVPGRDITVGIPADLTIAESAPVSVSTEGDARPGPAVPVLALRQDDDGTYVELLGAAPTGEAKREKVYVTVTAQAAGWAAIESDRLSIGTRVYVSK